MIGRDDFLVEIHTEELPPKALYHLGEAFALQMRERLQKADLSFDDIHFFATPRRLAVLVKNLIAAQPDQIIERKGPALNVAFDAQGQASKACEGFARSLGITTKELTTIKNEQGEWVAYQQSVPGKSVLTLLPTMVEQAAIALPIPKRMRWGDNDAQFTRPIHAVLMLYGDQIVAGSILGYPAGRVTRGHRFHAPDWMTIPHAAAYESLLASEGHVIADFAKRREMIQQQAAEIVRKQIHGEAHVFISSDEFLNEVTGLVEYPVALCGQFDAHFLALPDEVLISAMQDHQRYFPVYDAKNKLLSYFVTISNIDSHDAKRVIHGNERVLRARLSDAAFFYETDKKETLTHRITRLSGIVYQAKLGTLYDKAERISQIAIMISQKLKAETELAKRAALLAKTDLTTQMVNEFPELQGIMGGYYALHDGEGRAVSVAITEHYLPRFSGDKIPNSLLGKIIAIADRIDTLVGAFGINQIPTGDKDPYGLRRAALGVLRILIEGQLNLDLQEIIEFSAVSYIGKLENKAATTQVLNFMQERLRAWYQDQAVGADVFAAVAALRITNPLDIDARIKAVQAFKKLSAAGTLSVANKRVSNILTKYVDAIEAKKIDPTFFENEPEKELAKQLDAKSKVVADLSQSGKYDEVLLQLAELRVPVDNFFDHVMVMTEDKPRRENRLLLLAKLRALFLHVADIALLQ